MIIQLRLIFGTILILLFGSLSVVAQSTKAKQAFYSAMAGNNVAVWNQQLEAVKNFKGNNKTAFEGALLMRKSSVLKVPAQKLSTFKQGYKLLESSIAKEPKNVEYRFLRLMIQENAPKIVGYNKNLSEDSKLIKEGYKLLSAETQQAILAYSKQSKTLTGL